MTEVAAEVEVGVAVLTSPREPAGVVVEAVLLVARRAQGTSQGALQLQDQGRVRKHLWILVILITIEFAHSRRLRLKRSERHKILRTATTSIYYIASEVLRNEKTAIILPTSTCRNLVLLIFEVALIDPTIVFLLKGFF